MCAFKIQIAQVQLRTCRLSDSQFRVVCILASEFRPHDVVVS